MHTPDFLGWVQRSDNEIVQISIGDLIGFVYDRSDTQDGLKCWRIAHDKDSGERSRAHGPYCCTTVRVLYNTIQIIFEICVTRTLP